MTGQNDLLIQMVEDEYQELRAKASKQWRISFGFKIARALLTAGATIVLGFTFADKSHWIMTRNIALTLTTLNGTLSVLEGFWDVHGYWFKVKILCHEIEMLRKELILVLDVDSNLTTQMANQYQERLLSILDKKGDVWRNAMQRLPDNSFERNIPIPSVSTEK